jgi:hypothetical protein
MPKLEWKLPAGWEEVAAGGMRLASFRVKGNDGKTADVGVFPIGIAGSDLDNVNRWRGQVGQPAVTEEELAKIGEPVEIAGQPAKVYDQAGENAGSGEKTRILGAIMRREGGSWFFKMTGEDALVAGQKGAFMDFLKSLTFSSAVQAQLPPSHPPIEGMAVPAAAGAAAANPNKPAWQVPAGWQEVPGGQFLIAKFTIGSGADQAAVNVSMSGGDGGGLVGNVNRWRKQIGLPDLPEGDVSKLATALEVADGGKASLVDMTGKDARTGQDTRVLGAVVPHEGKTWFYKLMGNNQLVNREKDAFIKFVQTASYPHVH